MGEKLVESLALISHRGPDATHYQSWVADNRHIGFGHVRLSILDITANGDQPMISHSGKVAMVFNGEIYNYRELTASHLAGFEFRGDSDSEVLLELYSRFGPKIFEQLRGIFAAAFLDISSGELVVVRDQMGVKPIYYSDNESGFYASSEIKGLLPFIQAAPEVDMDDLFEFLNCGFVYEPNTGLKHIKKVPAGTFLRVRDGRSEIVRYFDLAVETKGAKDFDEILIRSAIEKQLISDVKLGVFFSGGTDSSVIAAIANRPTLFAAYNSEELERSGVINDEPYAKEISRHLGIEMNRVTIDTGDTDSEAVLAAMKAVASGTEELISDFTYSVSSKLAFASRNLGFKVMLSGMGGDETFLGYPRYMLLQNRSLLSRISCLLKFQPIYWMLRSRRTLSKKIDRLLSFCDESDFNQAYNRLLGYFNTSELSALWARDFNEFNERMLARQKMLLNKFESDHEVVKALVLDYHGFLSHNLMVADKSSMEHGLEVRVPLLDQDLYCRHLASLRSEARPTGFGKEILKSFSRRLIPRQLLERPKTGFNPPLDLKIKKIGEKRILDLMKRSDLFSYVSLSAVEVIVSAHFNGHSNNTYKIWQLLYLTFWLETRPGVAKSMHRAHSAGGI